MTTAGKPVAGSCYMHLFKPFNKIKIIIMKSLSFSAVLLFSLLFSNFSIAQQTTKKETIKVWGNCGMCKKTIEKSAKSAGASTAVWNEDSKQLKVSYASNKSSASKIQQAIANAGYDTQDFTADAIVYDKLHGCCQYDRKETTTAVAVKTCCGKSTCTKDAATCSNKKLADNMSCCKENNCTADKTCCKDNSCSKDNTCCKK